MFDYAPEICAASSRLPLCARYLVVYGRSVSWRTSTRGSGDRFQVLWAVGALASGETEILGNWATQDGNQPTWALAEEDLRRRGVERIRILITDDAEAVAADFPGSPALLYRSACTSVSLASLQLTARQHRIAERTTSLADRINATIVRRLRRMAPLSSSAGALELVARSLAQASRRIETSSNTSSGAWHRPGSQSAPWPHTARRREMPIAARGPAR